MLKKLNCLFLYIHINSYLYPLCVNKKKRSAVFNNAVMICMHKIYRVRWAARCCSCEGGYSNLFFSSSSSFLSILSLRLMSNRDDPIWAVWWWRLYYDIDYIYTGSCLPFLLLLLGAATVQKKKIFCLRPTISFSALSCRLPVSTVWWFDSNKKRFPAAHASHQCRRAEYNGK